MCGMIVVSSIFENVLYLNYIRNGMIVGSFFYCSFARTIVVDDSHYRPSYNSKLKCSIDVSINCITPPCFIVDDKQTEESAS